MRWASERRWQSGVKIALRCIELGLGQKDALGEIGTSEVSSSEVSPDEVGHSQVSASEVSPNEVCASQVGASQVGTSEIFSNEVGASEVDFLALGVGSR